MKIAIIGANGQLGSDLCEILSGVHEVVALTHDQIEITEISSVQRVLSSLKPAMVINTAAYNLVPEAEKYPERAFQINGTGTLHLAQVCQDLQSRFIHYSTDYVFDGQKQSPYTEDDIPNPLSVYGNTKLCGEYFARNYCEKSYVVRVSGIYGKVPSRGKGGNFVTTMIRLAKEKPEVRVVTDEILTPTPTSEIAKNTARLLATDAFGLYHMSSAGAVSWYEFARVIWEILHLQTPLLPASVHDFPSIVKRPFYSVLDNKNLKKLGIDEMPGWRESLVEFLLNLK